MRIEILNHRFVKLNKFENRLNFRELKEYCIKLSPLHVYMSVLNWLFPERVCKKYKGKYAVPIGGEYVIDIDIYVIHKRHRHHYSALRKICEECLRISQALMVEVCEKVKEHYSKIAIVFSGKRGFHVHVLDFNFRDWTYYMKGIPLKAMKLLG